ncbi:DnaX DNA polymerase III, gamma/tau subunits [uncultured Caudovirales phage]|uniref:DNA-directed DNA polymerase n=1 Tax=uncultured Caudovirales phage TaxID=2100421 RepID=A0A6J5QUM7_9CAUD|nr:DnaX DNA polymerase III, gamma/tau subunits [uncultured Caudovirales phage]CAB4167366.1 DnaX DNA polymerase III, gamma/tau subunits [uncultured Caudovirales phage]CAB4174599.1 DnaX DNA polymerase III, gamma/tau subunits [uncultured Caudovirales phage]CAB4180302.1 DnaX DNA polymerase III, gamma/tau subunits [uncultured Caudovirales phage]CAB4186256.1 DnaX DNA polymerase III, gamma/tau subunits [uncultured Caudovirales phage]
MRLALKYRPTQFKDYKGQDHILKVLQTILKNKTKDQMPQGVLLGGPKGSGKTSLARTIASSLNCQNIQPDQSPCTLCPSCTSIQQFNSEAVLETDSATNGGVEDVRYLNKIARLQHSGKYRVFILDEAHCMSKEAASAFLKQLEEPKPEVLYIFCSSNPSLLPSTLRSRLLVFNYLPIKSPLISQRLLEIAQKEQIDLDAEAAKLIADHSEGSMRDAIGLLEHLHILDPHITTETYRTLYPLSPSSFAVDFINSCIDNQYQTFQELLFRAVSSFNSSYPLLDSIAEALSQVTIYHENATNQHSNSSNQHSNQHSNQANPTGIYRIKARTLASLYVYLWDLRVKIRNAPTSDFSMINLLWHVFSNNLSDLRQTHSQTALFTSPTKTNLVEMLGTTPTGKQKASDIASLFDDL